MIVIMNDFGLNIVWKIKNIWYNIDIDIVLSQLTVLMFVRSSTVPLHPFGWGGILRHNENKAKYRQTLFLPLVRNIRLLLTYRPIIINIYLDDFFRFNCHIEDFKCNY